MTNSTAALLSPVIAWDPDLSPLLILAVGSQSLIDYCEQQDNSLVKNCLVIEFIKTNNWQDCEFTLSVYSVGV